MEVLSCQQVRGTIKPCRQGFPGSALQQPQLSRQTHSPRSHSSPLLQETAPMLFIQLFYGSMNTPDATYLVKLTIPSSLSPQAMFYQSPKNLAVPFCLPCGLGIVWSWQICTSGYWNLELQWSCNYPITSSTQADVPYAASAVALKTSYLHDTC